MSLLGDLAFYIRRARGIPPDWRPEVEALTQEKFLSRVRGGWLLDLVLAAAGQHYGVEWGRYVVDEDVVKDVELRIAGLAKVVARDPADAGAIATLARKELDHRIRDGYLARVARNVWRDLWRHEKRQQKRETDTAKADSATYGEWARRPRDSQIAAPRAERDEMIRLVFGPDATSPPHELLALVWLGLDRSAADRTPQAVVEDLATLTLPELAKSWVQGYAAIEGREVSEVEALFQGMIDKASRRPRRFFRYWDPLLTVDKWVLQIEETEKADANRTGKKPLHMRLAYLYKRRLGYSSERIAAQLGPRRLDQLAADFVPECAIHEGRAANAIRAELERFLAGAGDETEPFNRLYKPHRKVLNWRYNVSRRVRAVEQEQLRLGLEIIVSRTFEPWQVMAFLQCHCLGRAPAIIAKEFGARPLTLMRDDLLREFAERWTSTPEHVRKSVPALSRMLLAREAAATLGKCPRHGDLAEALRSWSEEVRESVEHEFAGNPGVRLFALRHGLRAPAGKVAGA